MAPRRDVQVIAGRGEGGRILVAIDRVGQKQPAKEHDLSDEKNPHAQRAGFALLLHVLEMVLQRAVRPGFVCCG